ncbi:unnamed protein product [Adineta steineri]|uniref:Calcineurin-like phosphoesterase domain-containing protein n=1 Tax=Adineta steineri TaxID=433720 RepID=A0A814W1T0_9BILA|nr:unnamed protein product [Adineta steineri]
MASTELFDILKPADYDENPERYKKLSIVVVSDTHNNDDRLSIPNGDIFLHCGDFTNRHDWQNLSTDEIPQSIIDFNQWLENLPHRYKLAICGNHDINFSTYSSNDIQTKILTNCKYLKNELIEIEGISIYGCPWSFSEPNETKCSLIPSKIDILMTHIPPQFILDLTYQPNISPSIEPCSKCNNTVHGSYGHNGSKSLLKKIRKNIQPKIHCFGHIHEASGYKYEFNTLFINAAVELTNQPIKFNFYVDLHKH